MQRLQRVFAGVKASSESGVTQLDKRTAVGPTTGQVKTTATADEQKNRDTSGWVAHS